MYRGKPQDLLPSTFSDPLTTTATTRENGRIERKKDDTLDRVTNP